MTAANPEEDGAPQTLEGARAVLLGVALTTAMRQEHPLIAGHCDEGTLRKIVDLAWRHQFSTDRYGFKKEIRELQEYVAAKSAAARGHIA